ncbi:MAG: hypothetical protein ABIB47_04070 [Candidatus Woesearchaeota archaeon]
MRLFVEPFLRGGFGVELIYSFVIIVCSLMVYFGTKELYGLSSHKGIKYFRQAFLFFAIAYFFRSLIKFLLIFFNVRAIFDFSPRAFGILTLFLFMYFSSMAVFYLLYSVMWKKWDGNSKKVYLFHLLALVIAFGSTISMNLQLRLGLNIFLFIFVAFVVYIAYKNSREKKKGYNLYVIYTLLFAFWILNILDILIPNFLQTFQLFIYLASSGIFLLILYKVLKKTGS